MPIICLAKGGSPGRFAYLGFILIIGGAGAGWAGGLGDFSWFCAVLSSFAAMFSVFCVSKPLYFGFIRISEDLDSGGDGCCWAVSSSTTGLWFGTKSKIFFGVSLRVHMLVCTGFGVSPRYFSFILISLLGASALAAFAVSLRITSDLASGLGEPLL